jgi:hypothetical protein
MHNFFVQFANSLFSLASGQYGGTFFMDILGMTEEFYVLP